MLDVNDEREEEAKEAEEEKEEEEGEEEKEEEQDEAEKPKESGAEVSAGNLGHRLDARDLRTIISSSNFSSCA